MAEPVNTSLQLPGYSAGSDQIPGQAKKLIVRTQRGGGELNAEIATATRMFRTRKQDEFMSPLPRRVQTLDDVTYGLGLDSVSDTKVKEMVGDTRADYSKKGQTQRSFIAAGGLTSKLRTMKEIPSDARMEIVRRARAFWRNVEPVDYGKEPTVRARSGTQMRSDTRIGKSDVRFVVLTKAFGGSASEDDPSHQPHGSVPPAKKRPKLVVPTGGQPSPAAPPGRVTMLPGGAFGAVPSGAPSASAPPAAAGPAGAGGQTPPKGFTPIPNSKKGGFRSPDGSSYWYPGTGVTKAPHPADAKVAGKPRAPMQQSPFGQGAQAPAGAPQAPPGGAKPPPLPKTAPAGAGAPQPGKPGQPPPLPGKQPAQAQPGQPPPGAQPQAQGQQPGKPQIARGAGGEEMRQFHPQVQAVTPQGKEFDPAYHAGQHQMHKQARAEAEAMHDFPRALGHHHAMNFHAGRANQGVAMANGETYEPDQDYPGFDNDEGQGREVYERTPDGVQRNEHGERDQGTESRKKLVPEHDLVHEMRTRIGRAMNVMANLSAAHDHLGHVSEKLKLAKKGYAYSPDGNHQRISPRMARVMRTQFAAEMAATKHEIVQLHDAHDHAMKEVDQVHSHIKSQKFREHPIMRAFMHAMKMLHGASQQVAQKLGMGISAAGSAVASGAQAAKEKIGEAIENRGQQKKFEAGAEGRAALDQAASQQGPESEVKPLGVSKEDIESRFGTGDPDQDRQSQAKKVLASLGQDLGEEGEEEANPEDVEDVPEQPDEQEGEESEAMGDEEEPSDEEQPEGMEDEEAPEGEEAPPEGGEDADGLPPSAGHAPPTPAEDHATNEVDEALGEIQSPEMQEGLEGQLAQQSKEEGAQKKFAQDIGEHTKTRDTNERVAAQRAKAWAEKNAKMQSQQKKRKQSAALAPTFLARPGEAEEAEGDAEQSGTSAGTAISGVRKKKHAQAAEAGTIAGKKIRKSSILVKSAEWQKVLLLGMQLSATLRKASEPELMVPTKFIMQPIFHFGEMYED